MDALRSKWHVEEVQSSTGVAELENILSSYNRQWHVSGDTKSRNQISIGSRQLQDVLLTEMHMSEFRGVRDESTLDIAEEAYVGVTHVISGDLLVDSEQQCLNKSNVQIWSSRTPISFIATGPVSFLNFMVPEKTLHDRVPGFSGGYEVLGTDCAAGRLMASHMTAVLNAAKSHDRVDDRCVAGASVDVIANLIRCSNLYDRPYGPDYRLEEVKRFINENIKRCELCPSFIAQEFSMSLRALHNLFSEQNASVMRYVKEQRLMGAARDLEDPALSRVNVTEIGFKWAFSDSAHFSNAFKTRFGRSPSSYRLQLLDVSLGNPQSLS